MPLLKVLTGIIVEINTGTFSNDEGNIQNQRMMFCRALLVHLGYLGVITFRLDKTVSIQTKYAGIAKCNQYTMDWR